MSAKLYAPAVARNRQPLLDTLSELLPVSAQMLEIASGSGEHAVYLAEHQPGWHIQPSDCDPAALASIEAHRADAGLPNLAEALLLDACNPPNELCPVDAILCCNMVHIAPWNAALGLLALAAQLLRPTGQLLLYGPFRFHGHLAAASNQRFDQWLLEQDARFGVRDLDALDAAAAQCGLSREQCRAMPANNHVVVYRPCRPGAPSA